jgi:hypothetical protein
VNEESLLKLLARQWLQLLGTAEIWDQLWMDFTTRHQIPFTALIIGVQADCSSIDPVVVSSCIFMEDEKSKTQESSKLNKVNKNYLFLSHSFMCILFS